MRGAKRLIVSVMLLSGLIPCRADDVPAATTSPDIASLVRILNSPSEPLQRRTWACTRLGQIGIDKPEVKKALQLVAAEGNGLAALAKVYLRNSETDLKPGSTPPSWGGYNWPPPFSILCVEEPKHVHPIHLSEMIVQERAELRANVLDLLSVLRRGSPHDLVRLLRSVKSREPDEQRDAILVLWTIYPRLDDLLTKARVRHAIARRQDDPDAGVCNAAARILEYRDRLWAGNLCELLDDACSDVVHSNSLPPSAWPPLHTIPA